MKRREFLTFVVGAASWPIVAQARQSRKVARIGVLWHAGTAEEEAIFLTPLVDSLTKLGYVQGKNVTYEHRFPAEQPDRFKAMAAELAQLNLDVIITSASAAAYAAKAATRTTPIVFIIVADPVGGGLVNSLSRPGGNITGYAVVDVSPKRLQLLKETFPNLSRVALLINPDNRSTAQRFFDQVEAAATPLNLTVQPIEVQGPHDFQRALSVVPRDKKTGVMTVFDPMFFNERRQIAHVAMAYGLPVMAPADVYVKAGALMSYGPNLVDLFRRAATSVDKILKGEQAGNLPVELPIKYDLVINVATAKTIDMEVPATLLARADEVIE
ncbi:ABC transporter substrate-binding protein [Bradyrhizobium yuanmingense]|uniref:ABC transporter substrate-binding protein n=1 Tax=Bradyrhizobium yuanmingense TaxID=108015 RepID=UPI0023B93F8B|nr:ABC transporter substrate-binding protein [Bradyrhizobium yuanmingense]MDF0578580.1 ABC transporter substrate-binding protein [Bradyrhizobium yuanmingense]